MLEIPSTIVRKITGVMIIFTRFTKVSPTGFIALAAPGANRPRSTPSEMAKRTWNVRLLKRRRIGRKQGEEQRSVWYIPCASSPRPEPGSDHVELSEAAVP